MCLRTSSLTYSKQYLDDFCKALSSEVKVLLGEVGKLREERRALQLYVSGFIRELSALM